MAVNERNYDNMKCCTAYGINELSSCFDNVEKLEQTYGIDRFYCPQFAYLYLYDCTIDPDAPSFADNQLVPDKYVQPRFEESFLPSAAINVSGHHWSIDPDGAGNGSSFYLLMNDCVQRSTSTILDGQGLNMILNVSYDADDYSYTHPVRDEGTDFSRNINGVTVFFFCPPEYVPESATSDEIPAAKIISLNATLNSTNAVSLEDNWSKISYYDSDGRYNYSPETARVELTMALDYAFDGGGNWGCGFLGSDKNLNESAIGNGFAVQLLFNSGKSKYTFDYTILGILRYKYSEYGTYFYKNFNYNFKLTINML